MQRSSCTFFCAYVARALFDTTKETTTHAIVALFYVTRMPQVYVYITHTTLCRVLVRHLFRLFLWQVSIFPQLLLIPSPILINLYKKIKMHLQYTVQMTNEGESIRHRTHISVNSKQTMTSTHPLLEEILQLLSSIDSYILDLLASLPNYNALLRIPFH